MRIGCFIALMVLLVADAAVADAPRAIVVEVTAGKHQRDGTPVWLRLPEGWTDVRGLRLVAAETQAATPVQLVPSPEPHAVWIIRDLPAQSSRRYRLEATRDSAPRANAWWADDGRGLWLLVGNRPVLRYNHTEIASPPGLDPVYRRSGHIHPLLTPNGTTVTDDFPPDHAHQHGVFFAWVNTMFGGHHVDFWNQKDRSGRVRHVAMLDRGYGPVFAHFSARLRHDDVTNPSAPQAVIDEDWTVRVYDRSDVFLVDLESRQVGVAREPLDVLKYHYGGFGLRGNRQWLDPTVKGDAPPEPARSGASDFLTSEGMRRANGNHSRPRWVDLSGDVSGAPAGVAVLDHPSNRGFPQPVRLHPNKPYFCFAPMVLGPFAIEPGQTYVSRYRLVLHDGRPDSTLLERCWHDYTDPPVVRVVER